MYSQRLQAPIQTAAGNVPADVVPDVRVWYNPDLLSGNFIVPGLIVVIVMIIAANLGSLTIAREWENGTMEQLLSTPARPSEMALGKLSAYFVVGAVDMLIALVIGVFVFDVPHEGQLDAAAGFKRDLSVRRAGTGHHDLGDVPHPAHGVPDGNADFVPAGVSAVGIHLPHRQHAARDPGGFAIRAGALFHGSLARDFPERHRHTSCCGSICCC